MHAFNVSELFNTSERRFVRNYKFCIGKNKQYFFSFGVKKHSRKVYTCVVGDKLHLQTGTNNWEK